ncbi:hypothetical protein GCM10009716_12090 [Streptomyces sodiiphilus]|uniref:Uncharacterized protein n=1 Tax=Streptomyces sodiiphilus TaxID=226217 RepID=A0ABN2NVL1_9ACTN
MARITKLGLDWVSFTVAAGVVTTQSVALVNVYAINPVMRHYFNSPRRFLGAPGAWLPGQLGSFFKNNRAIQRMLSVPGTSGFRGRAFGSLWDSARRLLPNSRLFAGATPNTWINRFVGNDRFAHRLGYNPRVGTESVRGVRAGQTRLDWVARNVYSKAQGMGAGRWSAARTAVSGAAKAGGFLRFAGIGGGVAATGFSVANVVAQGNPVDAFKDDPLGYAADIAEVGFNASLTAAMVAPNPVTIGLAVGTGIVYGGLKIAENWDSVKETTGKAVDGIKNVAGGVADGAKKLAGKLNPFG